MALADRFVDGGTIHWRRLGIALGGGLFLTIASIVSTAYLTASDVVAGLLTDLAGWLADVVGAWFGLPASGIGATAAGAIAFVTQLGPLAFPAAVGIVSLGLYLIAEVLPGDE